MAKHALVVAVLLGHLTEAEALSGEWFYHGQAHGKFVLVHGASGKRILV